MTGYKYCQVWAASLASLCIYLCHLPTFIMAPCRTLIAVVAALGTVNAMPFTIPYLDKTGRIEVQGHRGGLGMRSEESLWVRTSAGG
jgi:hypothetical protein